MAQGNGAIYNVMKMNVFDAVYDVTADTLKMMLVVAYTPDIDAHLVKGTTGVDSTEVSDSSYTDGGETLSTVTNTQDNTNDRAALDAVDVTYTALDAGTPSHCILYDDTPTSPLDPLMSYWELGTTASNGGDYILVFGANGFILQT